MKDYFSICKKKRCFRGDAGGTKLLYLTNRLHLSEMLSFPCRCYCSSCKLYFIIFYFSFQFFNLFSLSLVLPFSLKKTTKQPTYNDEGVVSAKKTTQRGRRVCQGSGQAGSGPERLRQGSGSARRRRCVRQGSGQATVTEEPIPTKRFAGIWCEILQGLWARGRPEIGENGFAVIM
jgi:hypothetical protein